jgi:hypothetical protein
MRYLKSTVFLSALLVAVLASGTFASVAAAQTAGSAAQQQPSGPRPVEIVGQVTSVSTNSLVLKTRRGDVTANVSSSTWILVEKDGRRVEGALSDIQTGMPATISGMTTADPGVIDARVIRQGRLERAGARVRSRVVMRRIAEHFAGGTIKAVNGTTLTVTTERGQDITVNTTADTAVLNGGFKSVDTLKVGDNVQLVGKPNRPERPATPPSTRPAQRTRTIDAAAIRVVTTNSKLVIGRVDKLEGSTITLRAPRERAGIEVTLDGSTEYRAFSAADGKLVAASQADVTGGSNIIVEGITGVNGNNILARAVIILPGANNRPARP